MKKFFVSISLVFLIFTSSADDIILITPKNLSLKLEKNNQIFLKWSDNSTNEDFYELVVLERNNKRIWGLEKHYILPANSTNCSYYGIKDWEYKFYVRVGKGNVCTGYSNVKTIKLK